MEQKTVEYINIGVKFLVIILLIAFTIISFMPVISVAVYYNSDDCEQSAVYGMSSLFQRFINPDCPRVWDVKKFDFEKQDYVYHANSIIQCDNIHWFYDRSITP